MILRRRGIHCNTKGGAYTSPTQLTKIMTEERLKLINKINEEMKCLAEVIKKKEEGDSFDIRLKSLRTIDSFSVYPYLSESQRSEILTLIEKRLRENFDNYKKEFENL